MLNFIAEKKDRLDKFLAGQISEVSRGKIQKAIKDGLVLVNGGKVTETDFQIKENDFVELPEFVKEELKPSDIQLKVVYENDDLAVIDKPAGMVVHPGAGNVEDTLAQALLSRFPGIEKVGDPHRPGIVHRLDEDTSGLLVIAKTQPAFDYLKNLFKTRDIQKEYLALVHGVPAKLHDIIDLPLVKNPKRQKMTVGEGKEAVTEYSVLAVAEDFSLPKNGGLKTSATKPPPGLRDSTNPLQYSLLRVKLHTGRTHQIRAHLSHIGHPVVGDKIYGPFKNKDEKLLSRQFLHAHRLKFKLMDGSTVELFSQLPEELANLLKKLNIVIPDSIRNPEQ